MKDSTKGLRIAVLGTAVAVLCLAGIASDKAADNAKAYQTELEAMIGQQPPKILEKLAEWQFERADSWMAENPTAKDVSKHDQGKVKFSKQEIRDLLGQPEQYKFATYGKVVGTSSATMGTIDGTGMSFSKDATVDLQVLTVIRIVFRDNKLINVRTWPKIEGMHMTGGNAWRVR
jgi:hypothetical protein